MNKNKIKILILENPDDVGEEAASIISKQVKSKSNSVLGLASGETMLPMFKHLISKSKKEKVNFSKVKTFNLDEYFGLTKNDKNSSYQFMKKNLFSKLNLKEENINFPEEPSPQNYESKIKSSGGINLQVLGIGRNGHIGFNEPGSSFNSTTRKVKLSDTTRKDNSRFFSQLRVERASDSEPDRFRAKGAKRLLASNSPHAVANYNVPIKEVPTHALTMGIKTILDSKKIILLATGKKKADAIAKSILQKSTTKVPASALQKHKDVLFILDKESASKLK